MELHRKDGGISLIPPSSTWQTCWDGSAQYHCKDPPLQAKDFGEGVGHVVSINQSTFGMDSGALVFIPWYWYEFLQPFLEATLCLLQKKIPLLRQVIPVIDILIERLEDISSNSQYYSTIHAGAAKGLAILNKYYSKTDKSIMYRCTMSMLYHFEFFVKHNPLSLCISASSKVQINILSIEEMAAGVDRCSSHSLAWTVVNKLQAFNSWWTCNTVINEFGKLWVMRYTLNH